MDRRTQDPGITADTSLVATSSEISSRQKVAIGVVAVVGGLFWLNNYNADKNDRPPSYDNGPTYLDLDTSYCTKTYGSWDCNVKPEYRDNGTYSYDLDCVDFGYEFYVGFDDPHNLDDDNDGWACEGW